MVFQMLDSTLRWFMLGLAVSIHLPMLYSGYGEFLDTEAGFNPKVQSQLEISRINPPGSDSLLSGFKLSYLWVATKVKPKRA